MYKMYLFLQSVHVPALVRKQRNKIERSQALIAFPVRLKISSSAIEEMLAKLPYAYRRYTICFFYIIGFMLHVAALVRMNQNELCLTQMKFA